MIIILRLLDPEDDGTAVLPNVRYSLPSNMASHPKRLETSNIFLNLELLM
jgi:hypothetical protein